MDFDASRLRRIHAWSVINNERHATVRFNVRVLQRVSELDTADEKSILDECVSHRRHIRFSRSR